MSTTTETMPACMTRPIPSVDDYAACDRSGKSNMRSMRDATITEITDGIANGTIPTEIGFARYAEWRATESAWKSNTRSVSVRDYGSAARDRIATLSAAIVALRDGLVVPSDVPDEIVLTFDDAGTADMAAAVRIASEPLFRATKSDMAGSIESVMDHMTVGSFYTMTEIAHMVEKYAAAYAGRRASVGAVTNAVRNGIDGLTFGHNGTANGGTRES